MAGFVVRLRTSRARATAGWAAAALASLLIAACQADQNTGVGGGAPSDVASPSLASAAATPAPLPATPTPAPTQPPEQAVSVNFVNAPLTARPGQATTLIARTSPNTACSIEVDYKSGPSHAQGLVAKTSDARGNVAWTWIVGTRTTPGEWPISVTCGSTTNQTYINVT
jgi:hypothetical protein